jgi:hypothetical protein
VYCLFLQILKEALAWWTTFGKVLWCAGLNNGRGLLRGVTGCREMMV